MDFELYEINLMNKFACEMTKIKLSMKIFWI